MADRTIGFGVVGLGMGRQHCKALSTARGTRLVAVCDSDPERLNPVAESYGVKAYTDYAEMLRDPEIEGVCVATPSGMHAEMAMVAAAAGKHLLIEKPVDIDLERIRRLIATVRQHGVKAAVVFQTRTIPVFKRLKALVDSGRLGTLIGVHAILPWYRADSYFQGVHGSWRGTWAMDGGGSLMNQGVHTVDLIQWMAGPVSAVSGRFGVYAHDIETEDKAVAILRFANGALGTLTTTTAAYPGSDRIFLIHGTRGTVQINDHLVSWKLVDDKDGAEEREMMAFYGPPAARAEVVTVASDPLAVGATGHVFHVEDLAEAIRDNREPYTAIETAVHAVEIILAVYESGRSGREVILS